METVKNKSKDVRYLTLIALLNLLFAGIGLAGTPMVSKDCVRSRELLIQSQGRAPDSEQTGFQPIPVMTSVTCVENECESETRDAPMKTYRLTWLGKDVGESVAYDLVPTDHGCPTMKLERYGKK